MATSVALSPDLYREERYREGKFTCDVCLFWWPMSHLRVQTNGLRTGVMCCYEAVDEVDRDLNRAFAAKMAARLSAKEAEPTRGPNGEIYPGIDRIGTNPFVASFTPSPILLIHGGAPVTVTVTGGDFSEDDVFAYSSGVTDSVAPVLDSSTQWTLTLVASGGATIGRHPLSFNGSLFPGGIQVN